MATKKQVKRAELRKLCEKGKYESLLQAIVRPEELRRGFKPDLSQPIHYFAARGDLQAVRELVETYKCNPECQDVHGITPLHCASYCGRFSVVKSLVVEHKCDANVRDKKGACPLAYASYCVMGDITLKCPLYTFQKRTKPHRECIKTAKFLLSHSTLERSSLTRELCILRLPLQCGSFSDLEELEHTLNVKLGDNTPELCSEVAKCLEIALEQSKSSFVENILHKYANHLKVAIQISTEQSFTFSNVFHKFCSMADIDIIKIFFELDICKPDVRSVKIATDRKYYELVQFLLQSADHPLLWDKLEKWSSLLSYIFGHLKHDKKLIRLVVDATIGTDIRDAKGNTPLHLICNYSVTFIAEEYIHYQNVPNSQHELPVHIACKGITDLKLIKLVSSQLGEKHLNTQDAHGNTPLHNIIVYNNYWYYDANLEKLIECLEYFIHEKKCDINIQNKMGELPLHLFLKNINPNGKIMKVIKLLTGGKFYSFNSRDCSGNSPLHLACKIGDSESIIYLVSTFKCDLNIANDEGCIPLHYVISSKLAIQVVELVSIGCTQKCKQNNLGKTPLHIACADIHEPHNNEDNIEKGILLDLICDKNSINIKDNEGNTPLHIACQHGDLETATYLTSKFPCDLDLLNGDHRLPLHCAVDSYDRTDLLELVKIVSGCTLMHVQNNDGMTPLHIACEYGDNDVMRYLLLEKNCSPSCFKLSSDIYDNLEIHSACEDKSDIDLLKLMANECNVNNCDASFRAIKPLHVACENGNHLAVKFLLELNSDTLCKDLEERLPFHIACSQSLECVMLLLPYTKNHVVNTCDKYGNTPLHIAFKNNHLDIVGFLLSRFQCDFNIKNIHKELPMHLACKTTLYIVRMVMENSMSQKMSAKSTGRRQNISINSQTAEDNTPLHIACQFGSLDIVKYLTESFDCEPSMRLRNKEGKLSVDYACEHSLEMVKLVCQPCTVEDLVSRKHFGPHDHNMVHGEILKHTTLDFACISSSESLNIVKYLIKEKGCTLSALEENHIALWYACGLQCNDHEGTPKPDIVTYLIDKCGYNPFKAVQIEGKTLFQYCCDRNNLKLIEALTIRLDNTDTLGNGPLHYACKYECTDIVRYLVERRYNQNIINSERESALHIACRKSLEVTKLLTNCDANFKNANGNTPLHIACASKRKDIAQYLVEEMNCDVKVRNNEGEYPLHIATLNSLQIEILVQKSDINCQDNCGNTPLHNACYIQDSDMIKFLLHYQECRADIFNEEGELALQVLLNVCILSNCHCSQKALKNVMDGNKSSMKNLLQTVKMILQRYCAAAMIINNDGITPIDLAVMKGELELLEILLDFSEVDDVIRKSLLHKACEHGQSEIVHWLVDHEASTEVADDDKNYPQHVCFIHTYSCLETLKQLGPLDVLKRDKNDDTILHLACRRSNEDVLQYILQTQDNCKEGFLIQNVNKFTPLHLLAASRIVSPQNLALIKCDNPNLQDKSGNTVLHLACHYRYCELAEHLITSCKCDPNIVNDKGELPLHIAVAQSEMKIIEHLAKLNPENVNKCTNNGDSPLHIACQNGTSLELVKLIATSDNTNIQNSDGNSPLHIACSGKDLNIALYLLKELKCSVELLNEESETAFHILLNNNWSYDHSSTELQKSLLSYIPRHLKDVTNKSGDTFLHIACRKSYYESDVVAYIVETLGCKVDTINEHSGATALHFACSIGLLSVVKLVSQCDPTAQIKDVSYLPKELGFVSGDTPLHVACRKGNIKIIRHLLRSGHSQALNCQNDLKELPIHLAVAINQSIKLIHLFGQHQCCFDSNATDSNGDTPLHIICKHEPCSFALHIFMQKLELRVDIQNKEGNLPLHIVCQNKSICKRVVKLLCNNLSDDQIRTKNKTGNTVLHEFLKCEHSIDYTVKDFWLFLQIFAKRGFMPFESKDGQVLNYLYLACRYQKTNIVKHLCKTYIIPQSSNISMSVLLQRACLNYNNGVLRYLLELKTFEHAFDVNIPNENGDLPLHLAARMKVCKQSIIILITKTRDINYKNNQGETPLHILYNGDKIFRKTNELLKLMDSKNVDLLAKNANGDTPLHCMCRANKFDDLKAVLGQNKKLDANVQDGNGTTLLHLACQAHNFEAIELLLTVTNADPSIEDHQNQSPITLTTDPEIIKLLMAHGADPQPLAIMHKHFFKTFSCENPPPTPVKLLVIGYPSVGKTTLIQSLQNELSEEVISEHFDHTAGIVTTNFSSQHYGVVTFYDFAGQAEYYASHDAVLHSTIKNVPPIVLILVKLKKSTEVILNETKYWINIMANRCSGLGSEAAHMILVGSHADVLESKGRNPSEKVSNIHHSMEAQLDGKNIILKGSVYLDCTKSKSSEMSRLQQLLQQSTSDLREKGVMDFNLHCFYVFLLYMFRNSNVVHLGRILSTLKSKSKDEKDSPLFALPSSRRKVIEMCHDLNEKGHIMFIEHPTIIDMSWLILDKAPLLHEILGTLFSPTHFPQHRPLSYSTGVVPLSEFDEHFFAKHSYPSTLSLSFLSKMEYCREIKDPVVLKSIIKEEEFSKLETYYFFPDLVSLERPTDKWSKGKNSKFTYSSGWLIQCKTEDECFSPHFIQALLLRLAFSFTPKKEADGVNDIEIITDNSESEKEEEEDDESQIKEVVMKRLCSVWKNGIYWMEASGVKTVVDVIDQNTLVLLMQCLKDCEIDLLERRSSIISMVLSAKDEFCSKAELREYFIDPNFVTHPLTKSLEDIKKSSFSIRQIEKSIKKKRLCVINEKGEVIMLEELLYYEPFSELNKDETKLKFRNFPDQEKISIFRGRKPTIQGI